MTQVFIPLVLVAFAFIGAQDETLGGYARRYPIHSTVYIAMRWDVIEAEYGVYDWTYYDAVIAKMPEHINLIIGLKTSPQWAGKYENACAQPWPVYYDNFGRFVQAVVDRYGPWGVEIWNEPDVPPGAVSIENWLAGCWDDGAEYGSMLHVVYPMLQDTQVIAGGLMLAEWTQDWAGAALAGGDYDYVSYHAYVNQDPDTWSAVQDKAAVLRRMTDRPLIVTETAVLGPACDDAQLQAKAEYFNYLSGNYRNWVDGFLWYTIGGNGWRCSDLYPGAAYDLYASVFTTRYP